MAHYALLDNNDVVVNVIKGIDETELIEGVSPEIWYGNFHNMRCLRTSINNNIRGRYAMIGGYYDRELDKFMPRQPFPSWKLNKDECEWYPPTPAPGPGYRWDEETISWVELPSVQE